MNAISYTVACTFDEQDVAKRWLAWLYGEHLADVCAGGATSAEVLRMDGASIHYEIRYLFPSRAAFELYEKEHAPRLREEGLRLFPLELGLAYTRTVGEVVGHHLPG